MNEMYIRIENLCKDKGENITQMCKAADVPRGNLTDLKMNRTEALSTKTLSKIALHFGVSLDYLLGTENEKSPAPEGAELSEETMELILKQLSPAQLADLMGKVAQELKERGLQ